MKQLIRELNFQVIRLNLQRCFELTEASIGICAEGPYIERVGPLEAMPKLVAPIKDFLTRKWSKRWLISTDMEKSYARENHIRYAECPLGTTPDNLAEYLLIGVFEPCFRAKGMLVRAVDFSLPESKRGMAAIDDETVARYEAELGLTTADLRRIARFDGEFPVISSAGALDRHLAAGPFSNRRQQARRDNEKSAKPQGSMQTV